MPTRGLWTPNLTGLQVVALQLRLSRLMVEDDGNRTADPLLVRQCASSWANPPFAWQRPTLTGTRSQLQSALESLTSVFRMARCWPSLPIINRLYSFKDKIIVTSFTFESQTSFLYSFKTQITLLHIIWFYPRLISNSCSPHCHHASTSNLSLIIFQGSTAYANGKFILQGASLLRCFIT